MIPEEWEEVSLGKLGRFKNGINKDSAAFGSGLPFVNLMDVFGQNHLLPNVELGLLQTSASERATYNLKAGDVLFVRSSVKPSGVGLTAVALQDMPNTVFSGFLLRYRDKGGLDIDFKKHVFYAERFRAEVIGRSSVSANTNINQSNLVGISIPLPPLPEQHAIAEALGDGDALIETLEAMIAKKRNIKQSAMQELLTGHRRLPGFQGEWRDAQLGTLGSFAKGTGVMKDEATSGSLPCVRYGELYTHHSDIIRQFNSHISADVAKGALRLRKGDVLFAGSGETKEEIGKCAALITDIEAYAGGDIVVLRLSSASAEFFGYCLNGPEVQSQKASKGQGDAVVHISSRALASIELHFPPTVDEQRAIAAVLLDIDAEIDALEDKLEKMRSVKQGMMQVLLTGEIRLV